MLRWNNFLCKFGQKKRGVEYGGSYILNRLGLPATEQVIIKSTADYAKGYGAVNPKYFNVNLGGDHSIAACTVQPLLNKYGKNVLLLWIDAHADLNTYTASRSKNRHGMPVAALMGLMPHWYAAPKHLHLPAENLIYYGLRDTDPFERDYIALSGIRVFPTFEPGLLAAISEHPAKYIYISCDIDSMDPSVMPSTGTPVAQGLSLNNVLNVVRFSQKAKQLVGFDLVEFNPLIGSKKEVKRTLHGIQKILTLLPQQDARRKYLSYSHD